MNGSISGTLMMFLMQHQNEFISFGLTLVSAVVFFILRARVKLIWGRANNNFFRVETAQPQQPATETAAIQQRNIVTLYSEKHYVQNSGRVAAKDINIIFSGKPDSISIWQDREFKEARLQNGSYVITIPDVAPGELVVIDSLWITPNHGEVRGVRCADAVGKRVEFWVLRNFGRTFNLVSFLLGVLGAYYAIVLLLRLLIG